MHDTILPCILIAVSRSMLHDDDASVEDQEGSRKGRVGVFLAGTYCRGVAERKGKDWSSVEEPREAGMVHAVPSSQSQ